MTSNKVVWNGVCCSGIDTIYYYSIACDYPCEGTRACNFLALQIVEISSENHTWTGTQLVTTLMPIWPVIIALKHPEVGTHSNMDANVPCVYPCGSHKSFKNAPKHYIFFFSSQTTFTHSDCTNKPKIHDMSENI